MCIKIVHLEEQKEFNPSEPLETQMEGAKQILVSYDPIDPKIDSFLGQMERICKSGITWKAEIKVDTNNYLNGLKFERKIEKIKRKLDVNEVIKGLTKFHSETDKKLTELSKLCMGKMDEC